MADFPIFDNDVQGAVDRAFQAGGGRVVVEGRVKARGMIELRSNVELYLAPGGVLEAPSDPACYPEYEPADAVAEDGFAPEKGRKCFIGAARAENIAITGPGTVEMNGPAFYDTGKLGYRDYFYEKPAEPRPRMLELVHCRGVRLEGTHFHNAPSWSFWLVECSEMVIHGIRLTGDTRVPNQDGIHMDSCQKVMISDCFVRTGDDAVVVRAIRKTSDREFRSSEITITNCVLDSLCHGIRVGCPSDGIIRNVTVSNCVITGHAGIGFGNPEMYLHKVKGRLFTERIRFRNVIVDVEGTPLSMYVDKGLELERFGDIVFSDCDLRGGAPCKVFGWEGFRIGPLTFDGVRFSHMPEFTMCRALTMNRVVIADD